MPMLPYSMAPELTDDYIITVWETLPRYLRPTLLLSVQALSAQLGCDLTIASETFQHTGSFKFRAAYNLLSSIPQQHIVAASSGNFGQAVAYASTLLGKTCIIIMPNTSAQVKIDAVKSYGGIVDLIDVREVSRIGRMQQLLAQHPILM
jgi:threonine dehydratase